MLHALPSFNLPILMATIPTKLSLFFLLFTLSATLQPLHARESQFFSKFSNNNPKDTQLNIPTNQQQEQEPTFIPQTQESSGYGLYGHLPPSTTTPATTNGGTDDDLPATLPENYNTVAYTTPIHAKDSYVTTEPHYANKNQYNGGSRMYNNHMQGQFLDNGRYYDKNGENMYNSRKQGMGETSFMDTAAVGGNMYNTEKQGMSDNRVDMYNPREQGMGDTRFVDTWDRSTTHGGNQYNTEKQGMSDTRFTENGKYYYDLNSESFNANGDVKSRGIDSRNGYNTRGYYGNGYNTRGYYGNNDNSYNRYNANVRFQENQEDGFTP